jgi:hypothetical protein
VCANRDFNTSCFLAGFHEGRATSHSQQSTLVLLTARTHPLACAREVNSSRRLSFATLSAGLGFSVCPISVRAWLAEQINDFMVCCPFQNGVACRDCNRHNRRAHDHGYVIGRSVTHEVRRLLQSEGAGALYKGLAPALARGAVAGGGRLAGYNG